MAFKAVDMVRKIRDENYERTKDIPAEEQLRMTHENAARFLETLAGRQQTVSVVKSKSKARKRAEI